MTLKSAFTSSDGFIKNVSHLDRGGLKSEMKQKAYPVPQALDRAETLCALFAYKWVVISLKNRATWHWQWAGFARYRVFYMGSPPKTSLTDRERQVIALVGEGLTAEAIAEKLEISSRTVEVHRFKAMKFLSAKNTAHMVAMLKDEIIAELNERIAHLESLPRK